MEQVEISASEGEEEEEPEHNRSLYIQGQMVEVDDQKFTNNDDGFGETLAGTQSNIGLLNNQRFVADKKVKFADDVKEGAMNNK